MLRNQVTTFVLCLASIQVLVFIAFRRATAQDAPSPRPPVSVCDLSACDGLGCDQECDYRMLAKDPSPTPLADLPAQLLLLQTNRWTVRGHFQAGLNGVFEENVFWNLADTVVPPVDFDNDPDWLESYIKPGVSFNWFPQEQLECYGEVSCVLSGTLGIDAFDRGDTSRGTVEEGYLGFRLPAMEDSGLGIDFSIGPRELKLGSGMLVANGGQNGFERGTLKLGPRKAWEFAALGRLSKGPTEMTLFYLDANELRSNDTQTTLGGVDLRFAFAGNQYLGLTYLYVPTSGSPYPQAAPGGVGTPSVLLGAREGLHALNSYARATPLPSVPDVFVSADFAYEQNDRINLRAWGGRLQAGKTLAFLPFKPSLTYSFQTFSGDDPNTARLERFDPLFFEGSPSSWSTGSKSALVFINSNVNSHQFALSYAVNPQNTVTLRYAHVRANELRSPIQFGQATRVELENGISTVIAGVQDPHVSDDFFIEYNRVINPNTFLTAGYSISSPGRGIELVAPGQTPLWPGGFMNVVVNY